MAALLAFGLIAGVPWWVAVVLGVGSVQPVVTLAGVVGWVLIAGDRPPGISPADEAAFLTGVGGELRAGASLRAALAAATLPHPGFAAVARAATAGAPMVVVAEKLRAALPFSATLVAPTTVYAAESGARAAALFDRLAVRAGEEAEERRERSAATAQARLSSWIIGSLPVAALAFAIVTGTAGALVASGPIGVGAMAIGIGLLVLGLVSVATISRAVER